MIVWRHTDCSLDFDIHFKIFTMSSIWKAGGPYEIILLVLSSTCAPIESLFSVDLSRDLSFVSFCTVVFLASRYSANLYFPFLPLFKPCDGSAKKQFFGTALCDEN